MTKPTWQNTLYPHKFDYWIGSFQELAESQGYPYFWWNDIVFDTKTHKPIGAAKELLA